MPDIVLDTENIIISEVDTTLLLMSLIFSREETDNKLSKN